MAIYSGMIQLTITKTRFNGLGFTNVGTGYWRMLDTATEEFIGSHYKTKSELLADLPNFAKERGFA